MSIDTDVRLARTLKASRRELKRAATVLDDARRAAHGTPLAQELIAEISVLNKARSKLLTALNEVKARIRSRFSVRKEALDA